MARTQTTSSVLLVALLLAFVCMMPSLAYAVDAQLAAGSVTVGSEEEIQSSPNIEYRLLANGKGAWKSDGAASVIPNGQSATKVQIKLGDGQMGSVQYKAYVNGFGWQGLRANGRSAGSSTASSKSVSAVRIALTGKVSQLYDVIYKAKNADGSWGPWLKNGKTAGVKNGTLTGLRIKLRAKAKKTASGAGIVDINYRAKLKNARWQPWVSNYAGAGKVSKTARIQALRMKLDAGAYGGHVQYRIRLAGGEWLPWKTDGASTGEYNSIEAIQIKLTGSISKKYDIVYRTYVNGVGWQSRVSNGTTAGTSEGRRIKAVQIKVVSKAKRSGWFGSGKTWSYYQNGTLLKSRWLSTTESPINVMTVRSKRYWLDANGKLAVARIVDPSTKLDAASGKAYYASDWGYIRGGVKLSTSKGIALVGRDGVVLSRTGWFETAIFDDVNKRYYLKSAGSFSVVKTGFFKVAGKTYYAIPNRGYILRDATKLIGGTWYVADSAGVLKKLTSADSLVERYVSWAIGIAQDNSHGYTQDLSGRWGPDYDCSSLVISSLMSVGLPVGAATYTGNMKSELTARGWVWHTNMSTIRRGDILLVHKVGGRQHTEIYLGGGRTVGAHSSETGGIYGVTGDQTGDEINVGPYYSIWQGYLRLGR